MQLLVAAVAAETLAAAVVAVAVLPSVLDFQFLQEPLMTLQSQVVVLRPMTETTLGFEVLTRAQFSFTQRAAALVDQCLRMPI
jgi:hypothetical protein